MKIIKCAIALLFGIMTPVLIWVGASTALYQSRKRVKPLVCRVTFCSIDSDCPTGYICIDGKCMPSQIA